MAVRNFDGTGDYIDLALGNCNLTPTEEFVMAGVIKRGADNSYDGIFSLQDAAHTPRLAFEITDGGGATPNTLELNINNGFAAYLPIQTPTPLQITVADGWIIWVVRCSNTGATPTFSLFEAGAWVHRLAQLATSVLSGTLSYIRIGRWGNGTADDINMRLAAMWFARGTGANVSDATVESWDGATLSTILGTLPTNKAGWEFNQAAWSDVVTDASGGGANSTAINGNGTIITGDDPPSGVYTLGAAGGPAIPLPVSVPGW